MSGARRGALSPPTHPKRSGWDLRMCFNELSVPPSANELLAAVRGCGRSLELWSRDLAGVQTDSCSFTLLVKA